MSALSQAVGIWHHHCFQLVRSEGFYERGVYRKTGTKITWQKGNVQPSAKADIDRLPEGSRADGAVTVFTHAFMHTANAPNQVADRIMYQGIVYEVSAVEYWPGHNRYVCTKVGQ